MDYRSIIESKYNRTDWQNLLHDIFRQNIKFWQQPVEVSVDANMAKSALYIGKISLPDGHAIAVYEVELSDKVVIERNRAGIRNLLCTNWRGMGCAGAFMFCYRQNESVLRFSYVSESFVFAEDGCLKKESTDTKRFTYLLGEGHRSRTAIDQFEKLKKSSLDLKAVTKAFSVEALSKSFFDDYKKQYEDIVEFVTGKRMVKVSNKWVEKDTCEPCSEIMHEFAAFPDAEKAVRDYVKKLMGRLVFIQFLQKKGWMGCPAGEAWKNGDREFVQNLFANTPHKETFVDDVLEPLFNDINTKRHGDLTSSPNVGENIKIPYLNGGLFENDDYDKTKFPLPAKYMKSMLDFFANYNFTIDENDPDDAEIGVDPEMLGRIFENLLEDNKDKGAFYTPKEIVQYMCRESLIAYLQTDITEECVRDSIRQFATSYDATSLNEELKEVIDQKLKDVKICDPAIGSGAFPMGLLRELYACRKAIEGIDDVTAVSIKTHIIQNNIYGVDFEKGAVDIARLRFWLALIVDEQNPHALPNMDFKIMLGNSLLEQYEGVDLSGMSLNEQEKKKSRSKKQEAWQQTFAFDENDALKNIQNAIREYYLTDDHAAKSRLRDVVNENVRNYIRNLKGCTPDILEKLENLPIPNNQFFLWHIYFKDVFDKGGFDIVIGNPPYVNVQLMTDKEKIIYKKRFRFFYKRCDLFALFFEIALDITSDKGIVNLIIPSVVHSNLSYAKLRDCVLNNHWLSEVCYTGGKVFSAPTVDTTILKCNKQGNTHIVLKNATDFCNHKVFEVEADYFSTFQNIISVGQRNTIYDKLFRIDFNEINDSFSVFQGIVTGNNPAFIFETEEEALEHGITPTLLHSFCHGRDIGRYKITNRDRRILYVDNSVNIEQYPQTLTWLMNFKDKLSNRREVKRGVIKWYGLQWPRVKSELDIKEKILIQRTRNEALKQRIVATLDDTAVYGMEGIYFIFPKTSSISLHFLLGILNSKLMNYLFATKFLNLAIKAEYLKQVRIPHRENGDITSLVDRILSLKKENPSADTSALEAEIDQLVYQLYGLTDDEISIIENSTK